MADAADLKGYLEHGNWCLGSAFYLGDVCFIEQVAGAGEWLVIKQNVAFESASCGVMIATRYAFAAAAEINVWGANTRAVMQRGCTRGSVRRVGRGA